MKQKLYWFGNIAKSRVIADILNQELKSRSVTVFDYGCGEGGDWPEILSDHPWLRLVAFEPYAPSRLRARKRLENHAAEIYGENDISQLMLKADYIVSFSVLEHVVDRLAYLRHAKRLLAPHGVFYLNYDDGHFRCLLDLYRPASWPSTLKEFARIIASKPLAALGFTSKYQRRVNSHELNEMLEACGFRIESAYYENLACFKELAKTIPPHLQQSFAEWWLEVERYLNEHFKVRLQERHHGDQTNLWRQMLSRTLCLRHQ